VDLGESPNNVAHEPVRRKKGTREWDELVRTRRVEVCATASPKANRVAFVRARVELGLTSKECWYARATMVAMKERKLAKDGLTKELNTRGHAVV